MNLDSARNAKAEVFRDVFHYVAEFHASASDDIPTFAPSMEQIAERGAVDRLLPDQEIAIGIGKRDPESNKNDYEIVALVQRKALRDSPIIEQIRRKTESELRVINTGPIRKRNRARPLVPGCSVAHYRVTSGTLGWFVNLPGGAGVGILSNNHVLADMNAGTFGDLILQPGRHHGGRRDMDVCGALHTFIPIDFSPDGVNYVDCAVATRAPETDVDTETFFGPVPPWMPKPTGQISSSLQIGEEVFKMGHTTGATRGEVLALEVDNFWVKYSSRRGRTAAKFDRQIIVASEKSQFSKPGDSGSLIFDGQGKACALLFAGSDSVTAANPIDKVLEMLDCTLHMAPRGRG